MNHSEVFIYVSLCIRPTMSRICLLLHESEEELRMSVNNKDILRAQVGFNWLLSHLLMCPLIVRLLNALKLFNGPDMFIFFYGLGVML